MSVIGVDRRPGTSDLRASGAPDHRPGGSAATSCSPAAPPASAAGRSAPRAGRDVLHSGRPHAQAAGRTAAFDGDVLQSGHLDRACGRTQRPPGRGVLRAGHSAAHAAGRTRPSAQRPALRSSPTAHAVGRTGPSPRSSTTGTSAGNSGAGRASRQKEPTSSASPSPGPTWVTAWAVSTTPSSWTVVRPGRCAAGWPGRCTGRARR